MVIPRKVDGGDSREGPGKVQAGGCKCSGVAGRNLVLGSGQPSPWLNSCLSLLPSASCQGRGMKPPFDLRKCLQASELCWALASVLSPVTVPKHTSAFSSTGCAGRARPGWCRL